MPINFSFNLFPRKVFNDQESSANCHVLPWNKSIRRPSNESH